MKPCVISEEHEIISLNRSQLPSPISKSQIEADILERLFNVFSCNGRQSAKYLY